MLLQINKKKYYQALSQSNLCRQIASLFTYQKNIISTISWQKVWIAILYFLYLSQAVIWATPLPKKGIVNATVVAPKVQVCKGASQTIPPIVLKESGAADFGRAGGELLLNFTQPGITLGGNPQVIFGGSSQEGSNFSAVVESNTLKIRYFFKDTTEINTLTIYGLEVSNTGMTITQDSLKLKNVLSTIKGVDLNTVFAIVEGGDLPTTPVTFTQSVDTVCKSTDTTFAIAPLIGAATYEWELPSGMTGSSDSTSIRFQVSASALSGSIRVRGVSSTGCKSAWLTKNIVVASLPSLPVITTSTNNICVGQPLTIVARVIPGATKYRWHIPKELVPGDKDSVYVTTTSALTLMADAHIAGHSQVVQVTVAGENNCGTGAFQSKDFTIISIDAPPTFTQSVDTLCKNTDTTFAIAPLIGAATYEWELPSGMTGSSDSTSIRFQVSASALSGSIRVRGVSSTGCKSAWLTKNIVVASLPSLPVITTSTNNICVGQPLTIVARVIPGATKYRWHIPKELVPGDKDSVYVTTTSALTLMADAHIAGHSQVVQVTVAGENNCGTGAFQSKDFTIISIDAPPTFTQSIDVLCKGSEATFAIAPLAGAATYEWELPLGVTGSSTSASIRLQVSASALGGNIRVRGVSNAGCKGGWLTKNIKINTIPGVPTIDTTLTSICMGKSLTIVAKAVPGATSYRWHLPKELVPGDKDSIFIASSSAITVTADIATDTIAQVVQVGVAGQNICGTGTSSIQAFTIQPLPTIQFKNIKEGQAIPINSDSLLLEVSPVGGTFSGDGIVSKRGQTFFFPQLAGEGRHDIKYTYTNPITKCDTISKVTVSVYKFAPIDGLTPPYCKVDKHVTETFRIKKIQRSEPNSISYIHHLITKSGIQSIGSAPLRTDTTLVCVGNQATIPDATYEYTFRPSEVTTQIVRIEALIVEMTRLNAAAPWKCLQTRKVVLSEIVVKNPQFPEQVSASQSPACRGNRVTYAVPHFAGSTYQWTISPGGKIISGDSTDRITVVWSNSGTQQVKVVTTRDGCQFTLNENITVQERPSTLEFTLINPQPIYRTDNIIQLEAQVSDNKGKGEFIVNKTGSGFSQVFEAVNKRANVPISGLKGAGIYTLTYQYALNGCVFGTDTLSIEVADIPEVEIKQDNLKTYCISQDSLVPLQVVLKLDGVLQPTPTLQRDSIYFRIKRISDTTWQPLQDDNGNLTHWFNPNRPLPGQPVFSDNVSTDTWNQNAGVYAVAYVYKTQDRTVISKEVNITVAPMPKLTFTGLNSARKYCENDPLVVLSPLANGSAIMQDYQFKYRKVGSPDSSFLLLANDRFEPRQWKSGEYELLLEYTPKEGCANNSRRDEIVIVKILPSPQQINIVVTKPYNQPSFHLQASAHDTNAAWEWKWEFNDGATSRKSSLYKAHSNEVLGYTLTTTNDQGCAVKVEKKVKLDFTFEGHCLGSSTLFFNHSDVFEENPIQLGDSLQWNFGDQTISRQVNPQHTYQKAGVYVVTLTIWSQEATYHLQKRLDIFPVVKVTTQQAYLEGFEQGPGGWLNRGKADLKRQRVDTTSWHCKVPDDTLITDARGRVWVTDNGNYLGDNGAMINYFNNENSYVESPCFDISRLDKPMLSFRYWMATDQGADGAVLLYTIDDGKSWHRLGKKDIGLNWYNADRILSGPGDSLNKGSQGWSGVNKEWHLASYSLDEVLIAMNTQNVPQQKQIVRFRMVFASNGDNPANISLSGFAFDEFHLSSRNRVVLLEYFTNEGVSNAEPLDLATRQFPATGRNNEIISIHHHTSFPAYDALNAQNEKDPSARAFHQGVREVPLGLIDGKQRKAKNWDENEFYNRTLIPSPFIIEPGAPTIQNQEFTAAIDVQAVRDFNRPVVIHIVVIDTLVQSNNKTWHRVVRKMLPDAAGTYRTTAWKAGEVQTIKVKWNIGTLDPQGFQLVVFVEDYQDKSVHQTVVAKIRNQRPSGGNGNNQVTGITQAKNDEGLRVFPNPADEQMTVYLPYKLRNVHWTIIDLTGRVVKQGQWPWLPTKGKLDVSELAMGVYWLRILTENRVFYRKFEKK